MTFLRLFLRSVWIGICALSMLAQTRLLLDMSLRIDWLDGFVMGSVLFAYNFTHHDRPRKVIAWLAGLVGILCFIAPFLSDYVFRPVHSISSIRMFYWQAAAVFPAILWLFYYGLKRPGNAGLRSIPVAKPLVVALAWGWVTVMLPVPPEYWSGVAGVLIGRTAFIFALALAYDLADLNYDRRHGLTTMAGNLGFHKTFRLIFSALLLAAVCSYVNFFLQIYGGNVAFVLFVSLAISMYWIRILLHKTAWQGWQKLLIDALMPLQFLMVYVLKNIM